jgi:hypothetical protein
MTRVRDRCTTVYVVSDPEVIIAYCMAAPRSMDDIEDWISGKCDLQHLCSFHLEILYSIHLPRRPLVPYPRNFRVARQSTFATRVYSEPTTDFASNPTIRKFVIPDCVDLQSVGNSYPFPSDQSSLITQLPRRGPPHCGDGDAQLGPDKRFGASTPPST